MSRAVMISMRIRPQWCELIALGVKTIEVRKTKPKIKPPFKCLYGWHISDLVVYEKPKDYADFFYPPEKYCEKGLCAKCPKDQMPTPDGDYEFDCEWNRPLKRPPQSWCYVEEIQ